MDENVYYNEQTRRSVGKLALMEKNQNRSETVGEKNVASVGDGDEYYAASPALDDTLDFEWANTDGLFLNQPEPFVEVNFFPQGKLLLGNDAPLDLSPLVVRNIDAMPLFHYPRFNKHSYTDKLLGILQEEGAFTDGSDRSFDFGNGADLEQLRSSTRWFDYFLYYTMGIDRAGYFELRNDQEYKKTYPWARFQNEDDSEPEYSFESWNSNSI